MDLVLSGLQDQELFVYMDDIVIYVASLEEHKRKYNLLIDRLCKANIKLVRQMRIFKNRSNIFRVHNQQGWNQTES